MTSLAGEFQTDLSLDDALVACTKAIDGLGWHIEGVEGNRIVSYADTGSQHPPKIEVELSESGQATDIRVIGSDTEAHPLQPDDLIPELDRARDAIQASLEGSNDTSEQGPPAGWFPDPGGSGDQRYWDGEQWTSQTRRDQEAGLAKAAQGEQQPVVASERQGFANWWREHWRGPVIGAVAFLIGIGIGAAGGATDTTTVEQTTTETIPGPVRTQTQVRTETQTAEASPAPAPSAPASGAGGVQRFSGNGGQNLGTITVSATSTLRWTNTGGIFQIFTAEDVPVNSTAHSGQSVLDAGSHEDFQVNALGDWTITITPGG